MICYREQRIECGVDSLKCFLTRILYAVFAQHTNQLLLIKVNTMNNPNLEFCCAELFKEVARISKEWETDEMLPFPYNISYYSEHLFMSLFLSDDDELMLEICRIEDVMDPHLIDVSFIAECEMDPIQVAAYLESSRKAFEAMMA